MFCMNGLIYIFGQFDTVTTSLRIGFTETEFVHVLEKWWNSLQLKRLYTSRALKILQSKFTTIKIYEQIAH